MPPPSSRRRVVFFRRRRTLHMPNTFLTIQLDLLISGRMQVYTGWLLLQAGVLVWWVRHEHWILSLSSSSVVQLVEMPSWSTSRYSTSSSSPQTAAVTSSVSSSSAAAAATAKAVTRIYLFEGPKSLHSIYGPTKWRATFIVTLVKNSEQWLSGREKSIIRTQFYWCWSTFSWRVTSLLSTCSKKARLCFLRTVQYDDMQEFNVSIYPGWYIFGTGSVLWLYCFLMLRCESFYLVSVCHVVICFTNFVAWISAWFNLLIYFTMILSISCIFIQLCQCLYSPSISTIHGIDYNVA